MGKKVAGTVYIKVDGQQLTVTGGVEAPITDVTRETIARGYFSEVDRIPYVNADIVHTPDFPLEKIANATEMTVLVEFKNGKSYVLSGAYLVDEPASTGDEGQIQLVFNGVEGVWQ